MARFKRVALKKSENAAVVDELYEYDEPSIMKRFDLDLSKINIYFHQILHLAAGLRLFQFRLYYGKTAEDGSF